MQFFFAVRFGYINYFKLNLTKTEVFKDMKTFQNIGSLAELQIRSYGCEESKPPYHKLLARESI